MPNIETKLSSSSEREVFNGFVFALALYDVSDEIRLDAVRALIAGRLVTPAFKDTAPDYVKFERPPVIESLGPVTLESGEKFDAALHYYDYGVISVVLRLSFSGGWEHLEKLAASWSSSSVFDELTERIVRERVQSLKKAMVKCYDQWLNEDYYIFHLLNASAASNSAELLRDVGPKITQIVRGESSQLSEDERREVLQASISYYPSDLAVIGWNAAFLYDTESGADATLRLLEYANSQLLQFRHYDELLTRELRAVYRGLQARGGLFGGWRMRSAAARLKTDVLDITELTERTNNALKFVGDMFSARLYKFAATKIGVNDYQVLVQEKLRTAEDLYAFMIEQFHQARGFVLELMVVLILIIELVFLFHGASGAH